MLNPPSCDRCTILAGRFYRWNDGFQRHPQCDCVHVPATTNNLAEAYAQGLIDDPKTYFDSLSEEDQDRVFGKANAEAIRAGADMSQVVNAKRGMTQNGYTTTEGMGKRGYARSRIDGGRARATPELLMNVADGDRELFRRLLAEDGYLLPEGTVLKGKSYEGFGQMGRGGTRKAASQAVLDARATGIRDPMNRYTMTAAERRLYDAEMQYRMALSGWSPFVSPAFGNTPDPTGLLRAYGASSASGARRPVTPAELAAAEKAYRNALQAATGGGGKPPQTVFRYIGGFEDDNRLAVKALPVLDASKHGTVTIPPNLGRGKAPQDHEIGTMNRLAAMGFNVQFNVPSGIKNVANPDITMERLMWDMKAPTGGGKSNTSHQLSAIAEQASRGVIDLVRSPLDEASVANEVARRLMGMEKLEEVIVVFRDGSGVRFTRTGIL